MQASHPPEYKSILLIKHNENQIHWEQDVKQSFNSHLYLIDLKLMNIIDSRILPD